jgi:hypothetical protein
MKIRLLILEFVNTHRLTDRQTNKQTDIRTFKRYFSWPLDWTGRNIINYIFFKSRVNKFVIFIVTFISDDTISRQIMSK